MEKGETLILLTGCVLLCVGVSHVLGLSPLIASLGVGATMVNLSAESRRLFQALGQTDPPLYAIFFVIAGADLNIKLLTTIGVLGAIYVAVVWVGSLQDRGWLRGKRICRRQCERVSDWRCCRRQVWRFGLTITIGHRYPEIAPVVNTIVLASVVIFELIGPLSAKMALARSGEIAPSHLLPSFVLSRDGICPAMATSRRTPD